MKIKKIIAILATTVILSACQSFGVISKEFSGGENKDLVISKLGKPDSFQRTTDNGLLLIYRDKKIDAMRPFVLADYYYYFDEKNTLLAVEQKNIRDNTAEFNLEMARMHQRQMWNQEMQRRSQPQRIIVCQQGQMGCF